MADFAVISVLAQSRFPIYLAKSKRKKFVLKVFPFENESPSQHYLTEASFSQLNHPNLIKIFSAVDEKLSLKDGTLQKISCVLMEYAQHGDLFDLIKNENLPRDEKLARTYFHQIIDVLEYLHSNGVAHLDLKPENFLLADDYKLKLIDFEMAYMQGAVDIISLGSSGYRSPELISQDCGDPYSSDIFSAGIVLFVLKTAGQMPHTEDALYKGHDLWDLMQEKEETFWEIHSQALSMRKDFFDHDFRELFLGMTRADSRERTTLSDIKNSKWYNGPIYSHDELISLMNSQIQKRLN